MWIFHCFKRNTMFKRNIYTFLFLTVLCIAIYSMVPYASISIGNTTIWWIVNSLILIGYFLSIKYFFLKNNSKDFSWVTVYICLNVLNIIRGCFIAENYWDWKGLADNTFSLLLPLVSYSASNLLAARKILHSYIHLILPLFIIFIFFTIPDSYGLFLIPISF